MSDKLPIICMICGKEAEVEQTQLSSNLDLICEECKKSSENKELNNGLNKTKLES